MQAAHGDVSIAAMRERVMLRLWQNCQIKAVINVVFTNIRMAATGLRA
jgi:hypothetical protein